MKKIIFYLACFLSFCFFGFYFSNDKDISDKEKILNEEYSEVINKCVSCVFYKKDFFKKPTLISIGNSIDIHKNPNWEAFSPFIELNFRGKGWKDSIKADGDVISLCKNGINLTVRKIIDNEIELISFAFVYSLNKQECVYLNPKL